MKPTPLSLNYDMNLTVDRFYEIFHDFRMNQFEHDEFDQNWPKSFLPIKIQLETYERLF